MEFEHMIIKVDNGTGSEEKINTVNAETVRGELINRGGITFGAEYAPIPLHEFQNKVGQDGWEVCGAFAEDNFNAYHNVILKRQIE